MKISTELINLCKSNDRLSQKELYLKMLPYLRAVCQRYLIEQKYLKDILQDIFTQIFKKIDQYDSKKGPFHLWAVRIVINTSINQNKRKSTSHIDEFKLEHHDIGTTPIVYQKLANDELLTVLKSMPPMYYEVFNLYVIDDFEHNEIASILAITPEASRKRLSRAKYWLRNRMGQKHKINLNQQLKKSS